MSLPVTSGVTPFGSLFQAGKPRPGGGGAMLGPMGARPAPSQPGRPGNRNPQPCKPPSHGVRRAAYCVPARATCAPAAATLCACRGTRAFPGRFPKSRQKCNLETEKLCDYFSTHLGVYRPVLAALESLNRAVLTAMDTTKLEYEQASKVDQFVTRFLLRETVNQLQALQTSLEGASDTLEAQAHGQRLDEETIKAQSRPCGSRRAGRRALRSISWSPSWSPGSSDTGRSSEAEQQWRLQVNRLQELIDQLECKAPRLEPTHEEDLTKGFDSHILVAQRQVQVAEDALQDFHRALCCYMNFTGAQSHCLHVSAQKMLDNAAFTLYEFWQDEASWRRHQQSPCSKAFQRTLIDHLQAPDTLTTVFFPASWWIMNNN
ncbi:N-terminal EF-hand calcium-binding protein 3 isoform X2 [Mus musculus]|uniref:N-terminal EF-hand calcium-binding protein 3 isoform X2 n=2 Tax=Mus musculus TaxID=10090 RepID=UPI0005ABA4DD|nr:N-terminal EF-hand calcium-binding protein 3 isoform X2 [Mus musculus]|eukprot:XP_011238015.1 PREDICTED: N-terminal EF-hand calcium-binding protein 3 isoform X2 [Mus musculus]